MKLTDRRRAVEHAWQMFGVSEHRACTIFDVDKTLVRLTPRGVEVIASRGHIGAKSRPTVVALAAGGGGSCWLGKAWS